jgi:hypothetical protein
MKTLFGLGIIVKHSFLGLIFAHFQRKKNQSYFHCMLQKFLEELIFQEILVEQ